MLLIRKAKPEDAPAIAACLFLAMEAIVYQFIGQRNPSVATSFLLHFAESKNNQYSYENCWVAEKAHEVVAAVNIYDGARLATLRKPVLAYIQNQFGIDLQPEDETEAGEYYIDSLGVLPRYQGKGIGSQLLQFIIAVYVQEQGQTLGLLVDEDNSEAKRLYLKTGFRPAGNKLLLGKRMEHLQMKTGTNGRL